jgi:chitin synthase
MLESGFDDRPTPPTSTYAPRYQLSDTGSSTQLAGVSGNGYAPLTRATSPTPAAHLSPSAHLLSPNSPTFRTTGEDHRFYGHNGPGERYGPLGPLDPSSKF